MIESRKEYQRLFAIEYRKKHPLQNMYHNASPEELRKVAQWYEDLLTKTVG